MEGIAFDALTVAMVDEALTGRGLGIAQVAWAVSEAVANARQCRRPGIDVRVGRHGGTRDAATALAVRHALRIELSGPTGATTLRLAGHLVERRDGRTFEVDELGVGDSARFVAAHRDVLRLQVVQQLPETMRMGLSSLAGQPLARLVGHPALSRPGAERVLILSVDEPTPSSRSRVGMPRGVEEHGFDVRVDAPRIMVTPSRR